MKYAEELSQKIKAIQDKADKEIETLRKTFDLQSKVNCKVTSFDTFTLFEVETMEELKEVLSNFGATDKGESNKLYGKKEEYNFPYQIGVDNNIKNIVGRIDFVSDVLGKVWIQVNVNLLADITENASRKVSSSELHYYGGVSWEKIEQIRIPSKTFGFNNTAYYFGGDVKLKNEEIARNFISEVLNS